MAVVTNIANLSQTASLNGPDGAVDPPSALDDQDRYLGSFIAKLRDGVGYTPGAAVIALGYTPVEQGGGVGMMGNKVRIGWSGAKLLVAVDNNAFGNSWPIDADSTLGVRSGGTVGGARMVFNWNDPGGGSPNYIFCGNSVGDLFVRPPMALSVNYATSANYANSAGYATSAGSTPSATYANNSGQINGIGGWTYSNNNNNPAYLWATEGDGQYQHLTQPGALSVNYANTANYANSCGTANNSNLFVGQGSTYFVNNAGSAVRNLRNNGYIQMVSGVAGVGDVAWSTYLSDERLKKDIAPTTEDSLAKIDRLEFIRHRFRDDVLEGGAIDDGHMHPIALRAQQAESIDPEWITNTGSWKQPDVYPLLCDALHAIQQLSAMVRELTAQVKALAGNSST
jgi:hypothetical protein